MLLREGTSGTVSGPEERIGLLEALRSYTVSGARQDGAERWEGMLALGVDLTIVDGQVAYDADSPTDRRAAAVAQAVSWAAHPHPDGMCASC